MPPPPPQPSDPCNCHGDFFCNFLCYSGGSYQGCYTDDGNRALPVVAGERGDMTPAVCASLCGGYEYAGVQYSSQCFCGNDLGYQRVDDGECGSPCAGDGALRCGGAWRNSIYRTH